MAVDFLGALGAGSDIDSKSLVESLVAAERQPKEASLNSKIDAAEVAISAYGEVASRLGVLSAAFSQLNDVSDFESTTLTVSGNKTTDGSDAFTATLGSGASVGTSSSVRVNSLAQTERWVSTGVEATDTELNDGNAFTITLSGPTEAMLSSNVDISSDELTQSDHGFSTGDVLVYEDNGSGIGGLTSKGSYFVIRVDADTFKLAATASDAEGGTAIDLSSSGNDLQTFKIAEEVELSAGADITDIVTAINAGSSLGTASLIDRGAAAGSSRYVVAVEGSSGADNAFSIDTTASSGVYAKFTNTQDASNAQVTINGVSILRDSNVIDDVINGVTLNLSGISSSSGSVSIGLDSVPVAQKIRDLVTIYNEVESMFDAMMTADDTSEFGGVFSGDGSVRMMRATVRSLMISPSSTPSDSLTYLSDIGISISKTGSFEIDETRLSNALSNNFEEVVQLFSANTNNQSNFGEADRGIAGDAIVQLNSILGRDGTILTSSSRIEKSVDDYGEQLEELDRRMKQVYDRYLAQFTAMETAIDKINSTKDYLTTALEGLPFTNKNK